MAKKKKLGKRVVTIKAGNVRVHVHGRTKAAARANGTRFIKRYLRNVAEGFYAGGMFHPIRASKDYSRSRAVEGKSSKAKSVRATRATRKRALGR